MSKASEWAKDKRAERPVWTHGMVRAAVTVGGKYRKLNGISLAEDGYRRLSLEPSAALSLAHWIIDTFGEATP